MAKVQPEKTIRVGGIQVSIWDNSSDKGSYKSISVVKNYKVGDEWKQAKSFQASDIQLLKLAFDETLKYLYLRDVSKPKQENKRDDNVPF